MKSGVDLGGYIPRWFICPQTVTHLSSNHLIAIPVRESNPRLLIVSSTLYHYTATLLIFSCTVCGLQSVRSVCCRDISVTQILASASVRRSQRVTRVNAVRPMLGDTIHALDARSAPSCSLYACPKARTPLASYWCGFVQWRTQKFQLGASSPLPSLSLIHIWRCRRRG